MKKTYITKKTNIIDALDDIDAFIEKIELVMEDKPNLKYHYDIKITPIVENDYKWEVELNLEKHETNN